MVSLKHFFAALGLVVAAAAWAQPSTTPGEPPTDPVGPPPTTPPGGDVPDVPTTPPPALGIRLVNVSMRGSVAGPQGNANNSFGGFIVKDGTARVFVQGAGPRLRPNPGSGLVDFAVPDYLNAPSIDIWQGNTSARVLIARNQRWGSQVDVNGNAVSTPSITLLNTVRAAVGGYDYETGSFDSATLFSVAPGPYTMELSSATTATGTGVLGFWLDSTEDSVGSFSNVAARGVVRPGDVGRLTAGVVIAGPTTLRARIVAVALGPWLKTNAGLDGALTAPTLTVRSLAGVVQSTNSGWSTASNSAAIQTALNTVSSNITLTPGAADSAALVDLAPGPYTFEVSSTGTGIALVGVWIVGEVAAP